MRRLTALLLLLPALTFADETLLKCKGVTVDLYPGPIRHSLSQEITLAISGADVQASDSGKAKLSIKDGMHSYWNKIISSGDNWEYKLNTISGKLTKQVRVHAENGQLTTQYIATFQCTKVKRKLID
jgi:hypothetical protein